MPGLDKALGSPVPPSSAVCRFAAQIISEEGPRRGSPPPGLPEGSQCQWARAPDPPILVGCLKGGGAGSRLVLLVSATRRRERRIPRSCRVPYRRKRGSRLACVKHGHSHRSFVRFDLCKGERWHSHRRGVRLTCARRRWRVPTFENNRMVVVVAGLLVSPPRQVSARTLRPSSVGLLMRPPTERGPCDKPHARCHAVLFYYAFGIWTHEP